MDKNYITKAGVFDTLIDEYNYPERVVKDLCNFYSVEDLQKYIEFLETEYEL